MSVFVLLPTMSMFFNGIRLVMVDDLGNSECRSIASVHGWLTDRDERATSRFILPSPPEAGGNPWKINQLFS